MIDLLLGGSPCQGFSNAGKGLNFFDPRSKLFFDYVKAMEELKPKYFLLENVKMKKEYQDVISRHMGVEPIEINSSLVSAQTRQRLYWTNIPGVHKPIDRGVLLETILENGEVDKDKAYCLDANYFKGTNAKTYFCKSKRQIVWVIPEATKKGYVEVSNGDCVDLTFIKSKTRRGRLMIEKSNCLTASTYNYCKVTNDWFRLLTPIECERLQTLPDNYTEGISNTQRYKALGNGWTADVIAHILNYIPEKKLQVVVSLFDGISCGQVALQRADKQYNQYYASEIEKPAIEVTQRNFPHTMQLGDVTKIDWKSFIDRVNIIQKVS